MGNFYKNNSIPLFNFMESFFELFLNKHFSSRDEGLASITLILIIEIE